MNSVRLDDHRLAIGGRDDILQLRSPTTLARGTMAKTTPDTPADNDNGAVPAAPAETDDPAEEIDAVVDPELVTDEDDDEDEEDKEEATIVAAPPVAPRPPVRPQPGRPPSAKDEPPPPFDIGEKIILTQHTRPRTGTPIGPYPIGATGRVETVLSQTAIVRFDSAPETKEVVAFTCLKSAEPEREKAREKAAKERDRAAKEAEAEAEAAKQTSG
ncbi:MAG: hypothetical protein ACR2GX_03805 [Candidatus Dormibacteria bacterium]